MCVGNEVPTACQVDEELGGRALGLLSRTAVGMLLLRMRREYEASK